MSDDAVTILLVCAANVCRSPLAELTLRERFAAVGGAQPELLSAGVSAARGDAICAQVARLHGEPRWRELAGWHRSQPLEPEMVRRATLVLTASRAIRSAVVAAAPERRDAVFTLREAVWLGRGFRRPEHLSPGAALQTFQTHLDGMRGLRPLPQSRWRLHWERTQEPFDIRDGHGGRGAAHRRALHAVAEAVDEIADLVLPRAPRTR